GVRQTEDIQDGVHHRVGRRTHDAQNRAPVVFEEFYNWRLRSLGDFFYLLFKGLRFFQVLTNPQCCNGHQRTEQEWNAPAPGIELLIGQSCDGDEDQGGKNDSEHDAGGSKRRQETTATSWRVLHGKRCCTWRFTTSGQPLQ